MWALLSRLCAQSRVSRRRRCKSSFSHGTLHNIPSLFTIRRPPQCLSPIVRALHLPLCIRSRQLRLMPSHEFALARNHIASKSIASASLLEILVVLTASAWSAKIPVRSYWRQIVCILWHLAVVPSVASPTMTCLALAWRGATPKEWRRCRRPARPVLRAAAASEGVSRSVSLTSSHLVI